MKLNNQRASILGNQIKSMQDELDAMKGARAEDFLRTNIEDNDWTPNENFGESGYDWDTALDEGDISISGGPTFSKDKMSDEDIIKTYSSLTGAQKIEFARQVARRKGKTFDDQVSVAEQEQQEKINKAMELLTSLQTASPDTIRMAESNLKSYLNMFKDVIPETEMNLQMLDVGTAPNFNPEMSDPGQGSENVELPEPEAMDFPEENIEQKFEKEKVIRRRKTNQELQDTLEENKFIRQKPFGRRSG
jgi:hypothetical protein